MNDSKESRIDIPVNNLVITVGRQFGSGGRELGRKIADYLGIKYYDKELLSQAANDSGLSPEFVENNDERFPRFISSAMSFSMGYNNMSWYQSPTSISADSIYSAQSDVIRQLAAQGPCVIVGRSADYVLRDHPTVINIFVHAPAECCVDRIMGRSDIDSRAKAEKLRQRTNKLRANYYNFYTDKRWGDSTSYDLCFDTSLLSNDDIARIVAHYAALRFPHLGLKA
ncbi:MAG: cytidylate kinase-like family protein [Bacteroidales bacterium]|nr:cytidylate kinase-like family protein [Bacteroidales bacterium]MBD5235170.1 cytidylate kinase-like family protein [Barnesiella sp.]MBD5257189.1 cytidylate kinase-like family protein [Barnesiella sp.]